MGNRITVKLAIGLLALTTVAWTAEPKKQPEVDRTTRIWDIADKRAVGVADIWFKDGEFPKCIQLLKFRAELWPSDYEVYTDLGWMQENIQHWDEALATYVRFRNQNPNDKEAPYPEAQFYFMKKAYAKVPPLLEPTLAAKPHPDSFRILAHSYERLGLLSDSLRVWKQYLAFKPDDDAAKNNLNRIEAKMKGTAKPAARSRN